MRQAIATANFELEGLELLIKHYGIEAHDATMKFMQLSLHLARDHVPYFQAAGHRPGPKKNISRFALLEIDLAIRRAKVESSEAAALRHLCASVKPWCGIKADFADLARQLRAARKTDLFARLVAAAIKILPRANRLKALRKMRTNLVPA